MKIDVICLTKSENDAYYEMCSKTISTLFVSQPETEFNLVLVESSETPRPEYVDIKCGNHSNTINYISPGGKFGYNRFLNEGLQHAKDSDWLLIINNDLEFESGWLDRIMESAEIRPDIASFSPFEPDYHNRYYNGWASSEINESYEVGFGVCGWCILMKRSVMDTMGSWDERFLHWYQDNDYAETLKYNGFKHALIRSSIVHHLCESSKGLMDDGNLMTLGMKEVFENKWNKQ